MPKAAEIVSELLWFAIVALTVYAIACGDVLRSVFWCLLVGLVVWLIDRLFSGVQ